VTRISVTAVLVALLVFSSIAFAQKDVPKLEVFGGYSLFHADTQGVTGSTLDSFFGGTAGTFGIGNSFSGWNAEAQYNLNRWLGTVADFSGNYGTPVTASSASGITGLPGSQSYSFLFGPVVSYRTSKFTSFAHALFGVNRLNTDATTAGGVLSPAITDSAFAMGLGGGADVRLTRSISLRLGQLDYLYTRHDPFVLANSLFGSDQLAGVANHQNNLRFSSGIVFNFGK
jgi:opacity protein-like surface antigen